MEEAAKAEAAAEDLAKMERRKQGRCNEEATRGKRANVICLRGKINATNLQFIHESFALGLVQLYHAAV